MWKWTEQDYHAKDKKILVFILFAEFEEIDFKEI